MWGGSTVTLAHARRELINISLFQCLTNETTYLTGNEGQKFRAFFSENAPLQGYSRSSIVQLMHSRPSTPCAYLHIGLFACFYAITFEHSTFMKIASFKIKLV